MFHKSHCVGAIGVLITTAVLFLQGCSGPTDSEWWAKIPDRKGPTKVGSKEEGKVATGANNRMAFRLYS